MRYVFNELSTNNIASSKEEAHDWLQTFFEIGDLTTLRNEALSIASTIKFSHIHFHDETSFTNWISTIEDIEFKRRVLSMITKETIKDYPYYYYNGTQCQGLGNAYESEDISISYGQEHWPNHELVIKREQFDGQGQVEVNESLMVQHISSRDHFYIYFPVRKFVHNPKHDRVRPIANKGEEVSILDCSEERASKLLINAIGKESANDKQLFNFDNENGKYIVFYKHIDSEYHGYHINDENEIPHQVKIRLRGN